MNVKHQGKVNELAEAMASALKIECERLYRSGMVDVEGFDQDHYVLAKTLMTAAMERLKNDFAPRSDNKRPGMI